jgi:hypothetical protein
MTEHIQLLDDLGTELARAFRETERVPAPRWRRSTSRARTLAVALALASLLLATACAVPATRTAVGGIAGSLAAWVAGDDGDAPGRALRPSDHAPAWVTANGGGATRLIAEIHGIGLYVRRIESDSGPRLGFALGRGIAMIGSLDDWRKRFDQHAIVVLGNSIFRGPHHVLDDRGRVPLFGVTARDVERVELRYAEGSPLVGDAGDGGLVLMVAAWRRMRELIAYDATGHVLGRVDMSRRNLRYLCEKEPGCPPGAVPAAPGTRSLSHHKRSR